MGTSSESLSRHSANEDVHCVGQPQQINTRHLPPVACADTSEGARSALHARHVTRWRPRLRHQKHEHTLISPPVVLAPMKQVSMCFSPCLFRLLAAYACHKNGFVRTTFNMYRNCCAK